MDPTVTLWQYEWLQTGKSERVFRHMLAEYRRYVAWLGEASTVEAATHRHCLAYLAHRHEVGPGAAFSAWRTLRAFYAFLERLDGIPSPMAKVKVPKLPEPATKGVTEAEYRSLLAVATSHRDRAIVSLMWCTGLRRAELAALTLDDTNLEQRVLLVRTSKTGKPRVVPMSSEAHIQLLKYLRIRATHRHTALPNLWLGTKGALSPDGMREVIERLSKKAGVQVSSHCFRRAFAVNWLEHGGSQVSLMALAGWSSPAMAARYTRHAAGRVAEAEYRRLYD